jgi:hypothetical protein
MKKVLLTLNILLFLISSTVIAQTGLHFGIKAGYNIGTQYGILPPNIPYEVDSDALLGVTGGILLFFPVTEAFGVQQEFIFSAKGSSQHITTIQPPIKTSTDYKINYFELPLLFRYNFVNIGDFGIYGSSGFALSLLLNGEYKVDGVIDVGGTPVPFGETSDTDGLDKFDYSFIYGLGVKFNLFKQNCFFDYRQTIGWNTLMMPTSEGGEPAPLRNQTYSFALGMYF